MSNEAAQPEQAEQQPEVQPSESVVTHETVDAEQAPTETQHAPIEVGLQRSVRFGRIITSAIALGALCGLIASLFFPVAEGANYELGQVAGLMAVVGAAIGLAIGALLALLLGIVARRKRGAAIAVQTDVR